MRVITIGSYMPAMCSHIRPRGRFRGDFSALGPRKQAKSQKSLLDLDVETGACLMIPMH